MDEDYDEFVRDLIRQGYSRGLAEDIAQDQAYLQDAE